MSKKAIINNCWECFDYLKTKGIKGVHIFFIAIADIDEHREKLESRWELITPIPYLQKHHHFQALSFNSITYGVTSNSTKKKVLLTQEGKLNYNDVYTSSESDMNVDQEEPIHEDEYKKKLPPTLRSLNHSTGRPGLEPSTSSDIAESSRFVTGGNTDTQIGIGTYVLVRFESNNKKAGSKKEFKYIAVCQGPVENSEVKVMFMKGAKSENKNTFVMNDNDISDINISQILKILKEPTIKTCSNRIYYHFMNDFEVEKSQRSGSGVDDLYTSHLWYFNLLMFLTDHELPTTSIDNIEDLTQELDLEVDNNKDMLDGKGNNSIPSQSNINNEVRKKENATLVDASRINKRGGSDEIVVPAR
ncbi:hypothetical protein RN001_004955 [Aquatica leii]|uniref:Uncharacterized protein n=1 Tax=Aquatica leii TaxID=1421715 RepID=A0AAN7PFB7_9COLE|nr:hypothetical protein RN001_004955 [Aquatica leii]